MSKGAYIVIEGISGSGKSTLAQMLARELQSANIPVLNIGSPDSESDLTTQIITRLIEDPRYPTTSHAEVLLYNAARAQSLQSIRASIEAGITCIVEHSYLGTLVHEYYGRGRITDYNAANEIISFGASGLQPDLTVVLDTPVSTAAERLAKAHRKVDEVYLERVRAGYLWEAKQRDISVVYANEPVEAVFKHLQSYVSAVVSTLRPKSDDASPKHPVQSVAEVLANHPTSAKAVGIEQPVVAVSGQSQLVPEASAIKPPLHQSDLSKPAHYTIVKRVSVFAQQQLKQVPCVFYDDHATDTPFGHKDKNGRYHYYVPKNLPSELRSTYVQTMDQIFDSYTHVVTELTTYLGNTSNTPTPKRDGPWRAAIRETAHLVARPLLPVATESSISLRAPDQALKPLIASLQHNALSEVQNIGHEISREIHQDRSKNNTVSVDSSTTIGSLASKLLPNTHTSGTAFVTFAQLAPRNELDIVADILYEFSDLPLNDLRGEVLNWPYERKLTVFNAYMTSCFSETTSTSHALEAINYNFDLVANYGVVCDLAQPNFVTNSLVSQQLSPRIGYDTPELIDAADLSDAFADCFDLSLGLYSKLQAAGNQFEAQYATLLGHKTRCKVGYSAREFSRFYKQYHAAQDQPEHQQLAFEMYAKITEAHPLVAEAIQTAVQNKSTRVKLSPQAQRTKR
jgi:dTMP kinase